MYSVYTQVYIDEFNGTFGDNIQMDYACVDVWEFLEKDRCLLDKSNPNLYENLIEKIYLCLVCVCVYIWESKWDHIMHLQLIRIFLDDCIGTP